MPAVRPADVHTLPSCVKIWSASNFTWGERSHNGVAAGFEALKR